MKKLNISILLSFIVLTTGVLLLGGTTAALFSDTFQNPSNFFSSGSVDINLNQGDDTLFLNIENLLPGQAGSNPIFISNSGSLDLVYTIEIKTSGSLAEGKYPLDMFINDSQGNRVASNTHRYLSPGDQETLSVAWNLPIEAGNEYQGATASFGLFVHASQAVNITELP